jgi:hypothetical protein
MHKIGISIISGIAIGKLGHSKGNIGRNE